MWFHKKDKFPFKEGFKQASLVALYVAGVAQIMAHGNEWFGNVDNKAIAPIAFLTLFIVSALTCALFVFAKPYRLFVNKKGEEALNLVIATTKVLAVYMLLAFLWLWLR